MDITPTPTNTNTNANTNTNTNTDTPTPKSPEPDTETPTRIQHTKPLSVTNGVLKRHPPHHHPPHNHHHFSSPSILITTTYKECLKNHAATLGGHALDGCGEFMPSPTANHADPTSLKCAACGCHRNFHRREPEDSPPYVTTTTTIEYQPHHRHHPPPPQVQPSLNRSPNSASPPPISSSYYPSAPHMLLSLSGGLNENANMNVTQLPAGTSPRKRFRTKFSQTQKERMQQFAERVGWKMQKRDEDLVQEFCNEIGIDKGVLKVWMHNNKNTYAKKDQLNSTIRSSNLDQNLHNNNNNESNKNITNNNSNNSSEGLNHHHHHHHHRRHNHFENDGHDVVHAGINGSSSSS